MLFKALGRAGVHIIMTGKVVESLIEICRLVFMGIIFIFLGMSHMMSVASRVQRDFSIQSYGEWIILHFINLLRKLSWRAPWTSEEQCGGIIFSL